MFATLSSFSQALGENTFPKESEFQVLVGALWINKHLFKCRLLELHKEPTAGDRYISIPHLWKRNSEHRLLPAFPNWTPSVLPRRVIKSACYMRAANADPFRMGFVWICWACWVILCHHLSEMEPPAAVSDIATHGNRVLALNNLNLTSWCPLGWLLWAWWCAGTKFEVALGSEYLCVLLGRAFISRGHSRK